MVFVVVDDVFVGVIGIVDKICVGVWEVVCVFGKVWIEVVMLMGD